MRSCGNARDKSGQESYGAIMKFNFAPRLIARTLAVGIAISLFGVLIYLRVRSTPAVKPWGADVYIPPFRNTGHFSQNVGVAARAGILINQESDQEEYPAFEWQGGTLRQFIKYLLELSPEYQVEWHSERVLCIHHPRQGVDEQWICRFSIHNGDLSNLFSELDQYKVMPFPKSPRRINLKNIAEKKITIDLHNTRLRQVLNEASAQLDAVWDMDRNGYFYIYPRSHFLEKAQQTSE